MKATNETACAVTSEMAAAEQSFSTLEAVVAEYERPLLRYVCRLVGERYDEAQDIVQDVFIRCHHYRQEHGPEALDNLKCWLFRVAHNMAMDYGRRRGRRQRLRDQVMTDPAAAVGMVARGDDPEHAFARAEAGDLALRELDALPTEQRMVVHLKIIEGLTLREIGAIAELKIGTVNYRLTQGLRTLANRLREMGMT